MSVPAYVEGKDLTRYADKHGIEHNPSVACQKCGQEERWVAIQERGDWQIQYIEAHNHELDDDVVVSIALPVRGGESA